MEQQRWQRIAGWWWLAAGCLLLAGAGIALFALALRPCRFVIEPGWGATWEVIVRIAASADHTPGSAAPTEDIRCILTLLGLGPDHEAVAWCAGPAPATAFHMAYLPADGALRLRAPDGRIGPIGPQCMGFDFNLLPLPPGQEQEWRSTIVWSILPPSVRTVCVEARRLRATAWPEFRCQFPSSIEWIDPRTGRYRQVRGLVATYRFDTIRGLVTDAEVRYVFRDELPPPANYATRLVTYEVRLVKHWRIDHPERLRQAADLAARLDAARQRGMALPAAAIVALHAVGAPFSDLVDAWARHTPRP